MFPFVLGVFSGTLITVFLFLSVRSIDDLEADPPGMEARDGKININSDLSARDHDSTSQVLGEKKVVFHPRKAVSYNVLTQSMVSRGLAIHKTWAGGAKLKNHISFYTLTSVQSEDGILTALKKKMQITHLGTKEDTKTINVDGYQGIFELWKDICERKCDDYHWFVTVKDTVYLQTDKLEKLLTSLNSSQPIFIGRSVTPIGYKSDELGLRAGESYCFEGGYALSWQTLELVCPHLSACQEEAKSENEDVEIARCIRQHAGINCTASLEVCDNYHDHLSLIGNH